LKKYYKAVYITYGISTLIIIVISVIFFYRLNLLKHQSNEVDRTHQVIIQLERIRTALVTSETNQRAFLIRKDSSMIESKMIAHRKILAQVDSLRELVKDDANQMALLIKIKFVVSQRFQLMQRTADDFADGTLNYFERDFQQSMVIMKDFNELADKMETNSKEMLKNRSADKRIYEGSAPRYLATLMIITCLFQFASFFFITREIRIRHRYQKELENKIKDLHVTNAELEQIAFVASHDLQEPLRKIRTFTELIVQKQKSQLDQESQQLFSRLTEAAIRMQGLMEDLVNYTSIIQTDDITRLVHLDETVDNVMNTLRQKFETSNAIIEKEDLPQVMGQPKQLQLLFYNLIDNALKFTKPGVTPIIRITTTTVTGEEFDKFNQEMLNHPFIKISVSDNGIGFDESFAHKIFIIFQRLHTQNSTYTGKGIGLAICKRVMMNHNGHIQASGTPGVGATFHLYFPVVMS